MAGHVDDIVCSTKDEVVAILVSDTPVESGIGQPVLEVFEVGLHKELVLAPYSGEASWWQRWLHGHDAFFTDAALRAGVLT